MKIIKGNIKSLCPRATTPAKGAGRQAIYHTTSVAALGWDMLISVASHPE